MERRPISDDTQALGPVGVPPSTSTQAGWLLGGRYRVLDRIGSGGMAEVFRARDEVLERDVAVKVFRSEHFSAGESNGRERQQLEVQALARLNHPNLITLYDGCVDGSTPHAYIVMELIEGPSLGARIATGPLPEPSVREIGIQLADGLAYVHAQGMVHRDVKPENILLGVDRSDDDSTVRARLSDFGIVRLLDSQRLTSVNLTLGTASYLAPEQARGSHVEPPADIYSLGLVLLEALTGVRAFDGPPLAAAMARLSQGPEIPADLPPPWPGLLHAMTEADPALRPSAVEVARTLRDEGPRSLPLAPIAVPLAAGFADAATGVTPVVAMAPAARMAPAAGMAPGGGAPPGIGGFHSAGAPYDVPRRRRPSWMMIAASAAVVAIATTLGIFLSTGNDSGSPAQTPTNSRPSVAGHSSSSARPSISDLRHQAPPTAPHSRVRHRSPAHSSSIPASTASSSAATSSSPPAHSASASRSSAPSSSAPVSRPATSSAAVTSAPASSPAGTQAQGPSSAGHAADSTSAIADSGE